MGSVSMPQGKGSQMHNRREYDKYGRDIPDNIDPSKSGENVVIVDRNIKDAYEDIFGEALAEYNARQKRSDRQITDYYDHICKSKNGEKPFYEDIVQWGKKEDFVNPETREKALHALVQYAEGFQERNPNLIVIGAYIHMDEASPHLHLDYVPVAHGYNRGLSTRNSLDKALKEMGIAPEVETRKNNATKLWKDRERAVFGDLCRAQGLEVEAERQYGRKSLSVPEYKAIKDAVRQEALQEADQIRQAAYNDANHAVLAKQEAERKLQEINSQIAAKQADLGQIDAFTRQIKDVAPKLQQSIDNANDIKYGDGGVYVAPSPMAVLPATPQKKSAFGKVLQEAQPERVVMLKSDYDRLSSEYNILQEADLTDNIGSTLIKVADALNSNVYIMADKAIQAAEADRRNNDLVQSLQRQVRDLQNRVKATERTAQQKLRAAHEQMAKMANAVSMLKYDKELGFKASLTATQERLVDAICNYAAHHIDDDQLAKSAKTEVDLDHDIRLELADLEPSKSRSHSHDLSR